MIPRTLNRTARRVAQALAPVGRLTLAATIAGISLLHPATSPFAATPPAAEAATPATAYSAKVQASNPRLYLRMDETDALPAGTRAGGSMRFDGTGMLNTALDVQPSAMPQTTWEAWVKPSANSVIIMSDDDGGWDRTMLIDPTGHLLVHQLGNGTLLVHPQVVSLNQWHYVAVVYTQNAPTLLYLDGVPVVGGISQMGTTARNLMIGGSFVGGYFRGLMDEVAVYLGALSQAQLDVHYQAGRGQVPTPDGYNGLVLADHPIGYWPMDQQANPNFVPSFVHRYDATPTPGFVIANAAETAVAQPIGLAPANDPLIDGGGFAFGGAAGLVTTLDASPAAMPSTTWEAWVFNPNGPSPARQTLMCIDDGGFDRCLIIENGAYTVFTNRAVTHSLATVPVNAWHHVALVYTPTSATLYINGGAPTFLGAPKRVMEMGGTSLSGTANKFAVGVNPSFGEWFQGRIDDVAVYDRALPEIEIAEHADTRSHRNPLPAPQNVNVPPGYYSLVQSMQGQLFPLSPGTIFDSVAVPAAADGPGAAFTGSGAIGLQNNVSWGDFRSGAWAAWVKPQQTSQTQAIICGAGAQNGPNFCLSIAPSGQFIVEGLPIAPADLVLTNNQVIWGQWQHVMVSWSDHQLTFARNGVGANAQMAAFPGGPLTDVLPLQSPAAVSKQVTVAGDAARTVNFSGRIADVVVSASYYGLSQAQALSYATSPSVSVSGARSVNFDGSVVSVPTGTNAPRWWDLRSWTGWGASANGGIDRCTSSIPTGEGLNQPVTVTCIDRSGATASGTIFVSVDFTPPYGKLQLPPPDFTGLVNGVQQSWYNNQPKLPTTTDNLSVASCLSYFPGPGGATVTNYVPWFLCRDEAGWEILRHGDPINVDDEAPQRVHVVSPATGFKGWYGRTTPFLVTADLEAGSGLKECTTTATLVKRQFSANQWRDNTTGSVTCTDNVGNKTTRELFQFPYDTLGPVISNVPVFDWSSQTPSQDITLLLNAGELARSVTWNTFIRDYPDDSYINQSTVACTPASGSVFLAGATKVTCSVEDQFTNVGWTEFFVNLVPATPAVDPNVTVLGYNTKIAAPFTRTTLGTSLPSYSDWHSLVDQQYSWEKMLAHYIFIIDLSSKGSLDWLHERFFACWSMAPRFEQLIFPPGEVSNKVPRPDVDILHYWSDPHLLDSLANKDACLKDLLPVIPPQYAIDAEVATLIDLQRKLLGASYALSTAPSTGVTLQNGATPATVSVASYTGNPTPGLFSSGAGNFTDIYIANADASSRATVNLYYPESISGVNEVAWTLMFYNGTQWLPVLSAGGVPPAKNTNDNLDGTFSGGRVTFTLSNTSRPKITELNGTVFGMGADSSGPTISGTPANQTAEATSGAGAVVTWTAPTASDSIDGVRPVTCTPASGSTFALGDTTVTCTATDNAGNTGSATFKVSVVDTTKPTITAAANPAPNAAGWNKTDVTVTFTCADSGSGIQSCTAPATVSTEGAANVVSGTATDKANHTADASVIVKLDKTAPAITVPATQTASTTGPSATVTYPAATATDALSGVAGAVTCAPASGSSFPRGATTVTCSASDVAGNTGTASFTVTVTGPQLKDFVAFSTDQTWLKKGVTVVSGNVGANTAQAEATRRSKPKDDDDDERQAQDRKVEVRIGENSTLPAGGKVIGDTVWLRKGSKVGAVQSNELVKAKGVTTGALTDGVTLPLLTLPALPSITPGTVDVTVKKGQTRTLAAGAYDVVTVEKGATLTLSGGLYQITTLAVDQDAKVVVSAATELRVKNEVDLDKGASFVPASGSGITAKDIKVLVLGGDDRGRKHDEDDDVDDGESSPTAVSIGKDAKLQAGIYAPNGTVWLQKGVTATGAFVGKRLQVGENAKLTLDSGF